ncbi:hypothetical protein FA10DRAFT_301443 [Acaromyces ingoldii]|uniref:Transcription and mRNA export factor SUS1 n=1 Tax=Acaromyces ingoldii TaxID=215250 RepID=A0A316YLB2_9BASI|nr:hypothetical protein FA10DRAFT_301443 [Acaromyces ingoldii]PWN90167.1 hypothetical protein FA10DRAFT_301443 [Acaromyces ingoldii]
MAAEEQAAQSNSAGGGYESAEAFGGERGGGEGDELHNALHQRLVQTGEWHRILSALRQGLDESGWTATLRDRAMDQAAAQDKLSLPDLIAELSPYAQRTIPANVRDQIASMLHDFVSRNVEDA